MADNKKERAIVIGITGGIGSGKSLVGQMISDMGHKIIFTDDLAKSLMTEDDKLKSKVKKEFGDEMYDSEGGLNRQALAEKVFGDTPAHQDALDRLNTIVHPYVIDEMVRLIEEYDKAGADHVFVESALIFEAMLEEGFDYIIVVDASEENCIERTIQRSGAARSHVEKRIASQMSPADKKGHADFVIENNGTIDELKKAVKLVMGILLYLPATKK